MSRAGLTPGDYQEDREWPPGLILWERSPSLSDGPDAVPTDPRGVGSSSPAAHEHYPEKPTTSSCGNDGAQPHLLGTTKQTCLPMPLAVRSVPTCNLRVGASPPSPSRESM